MYAVIRIRGKIDVTKKVEATMKMLRLNEVNNSVIVPEDATYLGMIQKCRDNVAYGKINYETFLEMLKKRGRLIGGKRLDEGKIKELGFKGFDDLGKSIFDGKIKMSKIQSMHPIFRLTPPSKGHKSIKKHYPDGSLGDWGDKINELIKKMI